MEDQGKPAAASKRVSLKTVDGAKMAQGVYFAVFTDGTEFKADIRELGIGFDTLPPMVQRVLSYGLKQKLDDSMAGVDNVEEAVLEVNSTWAAIVAGNWTIRVAGEGAEGGLFARAWAETKGITLADAKGQIGQLVEKNLAANRAKQEGKKDAQEITERMVTNRIRAVALERNADLKAKYEELKAKKQAKKSKSADMEIDLE